MRATQPPSIRSRPTSAVCTTVLAPIASAGRSAMRQCCPRRASTTHSRCAPWRIPPPRLATRSAEAIRSSVARSTHFQIASTIALSGSD